MACPKLCSWVWPLPTLVQQAAHQSAPHRCVAHYRETTATEAAAVVGRDGAVVMPWPNWNLISKPNIWASWVYHSRYRWEIWTMFAVNILLGRIIVMTPFAASTNVLSFPSQAPLPSQWAEKGGSTDNNIKNTSPSCGLLMFGMGCYVHMLCSIPLANWLRTVTTF